MESLSKRILTVIGAIGALAACGSGGEKPGDVPAFDGIAESEIITALGNEPFWNAKIDGDTLVYSTPENIDGTTITISRFAGNGGLGLSGTFSGEALLLAITPGECSDAMSDRTYPFTATLTIGDDQRNGCAYTDQQPFTGEDMP